MGTHTTVFKAYSQVCTQGSLLVGSLLIGAPYRMLGIVSGLTTCRAKSLSTVLFLQPGSPEGLCMLVRTFYVFEFRFPFPWPALVLIEQRVLREREGVSSDWQLFAPCNHIDSMGAECWGQK